MSLTSSDHHWMASALAVAERGLGTTSPNPSVGAVIVRDNQLVARGWTQPGGRPHAEVEALRHAGADAHGATMYVTLEPCCHQGRSGPCTMQIIAAGLKRVVAAMCDPNPDVGGGGFQRLREAGIEVVVGAGHEAAAWMSAGHILTVETGRPFVQAKIALSADGRIAPGRGAPVWVTGDIARAHAHLVRARADAIVVGRGTVEADNPSLTCRLPGLTTSSPDRIVLASRCELSPDRTVIETASATPTAVVTTIDDFRDQDEARRLLAVGAAGAALYCLPETAAGQVDIRALLHELAQSQGYRRVLVEGGPTVLEAMQRGQLIDEFLVYQSPDALGDGGRRVPDALQPQTLAGSGEWCEMTPRTLGRDRLRRFRRLATAKTLLEATQAPHA